MRVPRWLPVFTGIMITLVFTASGEQNPGQQSRRPSPEGQEQKRPDTEEHPHDHGHFTHEDPHAWHLGVGLAAVRISGEAGLTPGYHLHLIRQLGQQHRWGAGLGWEMIPGDHAHHGLNLLLSSRIFHFLTLTAGPGVAISRHEGNRELLPALHTEAQLEFNLRGIHLGPMAGFGFDREESHFSVGLHIGLGF